jgi:hypothetical protein
MDPIKIQNLGEEEEDSKSQNSRNRRDDKIVFNQDVSGMIWLIDL